MQKASCSWGSPCNRRLCRSRKTARRCAVIYPYLSAGPLFLAVLMEFVKKFLPEHSEMPSWQVAVSSLKKKTISHRPTQTDTDDFGHRSPSATRRSHRYRYNHEGTKNTKRKSLKGCMREPRAQRQASIFLCSRLPHWSR